MISVLCWVTSSRQIVRTDFRQFVIGSFRGGDDDVVDAFRTVRFFLIVTYARAGAPTLIMPQTWVKNSSSIRFFVKTLDFVRETHVLTHVHRTISIVSWIDPGLPRRGVCVLLFYPVISVLVVVIILITNPLIKLN